MEKDPVAAYCAANGVAVADETMYVVAVEGKTYAYEAGFFQEDGIEDPIATDHLYQVAAPAVKRMRLRYEEDTLPAVNFSPDRFLSEGGYRELTRVEQDDLVDAFEEALERFPPL